VLRPFERFRRLVAPGQLRLALAPRADASVALRSDHPVDDAGVLLARLRGLGLRGISTCTLTANRSTVVSFRRDALRVHRAFTTAPGEVLQAIVRFVNGRGAARRQARRVLLAFEIPRAPEEVAARPRRRPSSHPDDSALTARLHEAHAALNRERFDGALGPVAIRVSRRMRSRLGHYSPGGSVPPEIAIARRHARRDGWASVVDTLVHEMVHQWQHETGRPVAHDRDFRRQCRTVGIGPHAKRPAPVR
jgi:SprT-like family